MAINPSIDGATTSAINRPCHAQCNPMTIAMVIEISAKFRPMEKKANPHGLFFTRYNNNVISLFMIHHVVSGKKITHTGVTRRKSLMGKQRTRQTSVKNASVTTGIACALVKKARYCSGVFL